MAKKKEVMINGVNFELQGVSPTWYLDLNDTCGMTGGKRCTADYMDGLFKGVVIAPKEVSTEGMKYFDEKEDIETAEKLLTEIETFLRKRS
ncbi:MAG: hypothetical protein ACK5H4_12125 [Lacrimispora sphenoides]